MFGKSEIIWLREVDSTNRFALENFDAFEHGTMIAAPHQSAGRGSKGRVWFSPPDVNVYASLILKGFDFTAPQAAWIGSLAVLEVLCNYAPRLDFSVKWPNDVLCGMKKIAGILCETTPGSRGIVIGAGINVNMDRKMLDSIGRPATSLYAETGALVDDVGAIAVEMRQEALNLYELACREGIDALHRIWSHENALMGKEISIRLHDGTVISGMAVDCTNDGALLLVGLADSQVYTITNGEILMPLKELNSSITQ